MTAIPSNLAPPEPKASPRVFLSHASEDKTFVLELARRLRSDGVDAWVDKWEIAVGDSLVDRIFNEGIGTCDAFLIVLSTISVQKPWVREELNSGVVEAIERSAKLLAIKIDDCDVPVALKSRKWLRLDPASYEAEYSELLGAIVGQQNKPPLGTIPAVALRQFGGYSIEESQVLRFLVESVSNFGNGWFDSEAFHAGIPGITAEGLHDAMEMLANDGLANVQWSLGGHFLVMLTAKAWLDHGPAILAIDVQSDLRILLAQVASEGACDGTALMTTTGLTPLRVTMGVSCLEEYGYLDVIRTLGGPLGGLYRITCTPSGRRAVRP